MRFPPDCIQVILRHFRTKEKLHQERVAEFQNDAFMSKVTSKRVTSKNDSDLYKLLRPQIRKRVEPNPFFNKQNFSNLNLSKESRREEISTMGSKEAPHPRLQRLNTSREDFPGMNRSDDRL